MDSRLIIPPAAALLIVGGCYGLQWRSIAGLEQQSSLLRDAIEARFAEVRIASGANAGSEGTGIKDPAQPIGWKEIARQLQEIQTIHGFGLSNHKFWILLQQRLLGCSERELAIAFDEIQGLDLADGVLGTLEGAIIEIYAVNFPRQALEQFSDRIFDGKVPGLYRALSFWAEDDPGAAIAWMDDKIEGGVFDSRSLVNPSDSRFMFESSLLRSLIGRDFEAARSRIEKLPEDQRGNLLLLTPVGRENYAEYASLVRETLSDESEIALVFERSIGWKGTSGDFNALDEFIESAALSRNELEMVVNKSVETSIASNRSHKYTDGDFRKIGEWVTRHLPDMEDDLIGRSLARALGSGMNSYGELIEIAAAYSGKEGSDAVLAAFWNETSASAKKEDLETLLQKISDPELRAELAKQMK